MLISFDEMVNGKILRVGGGGGGGGVAQLVIMIL